MRDQNSLVSTNQRLALFCVNKSEIRIVLCQPIIDQIVYHLPAFLLGHCGTGLLGDTSALLLRHRSAGLSGHSGAGLSGSLLGH